jgi:hypothetical protein
VSNLYAMCWTTVDGKRKKEYVHRKVWITHYGPIPSGWEIHHINGKRKDNRIENLVCLSHDDHEELHRGDLADAMEIIERVMETFWKPMGTLKKAEKMIGRMN